MTDEELERIKTKKNKTIHIMQFARMAEVNMIYFDTGYYAAPDTGFSFERHGGNHDIYRRGNEIEKIPGHKEVNESLARMILGKWKL